MQVTGEVVLSALAAVVALGVGGLAWRFRDADGARALVALNAAAAIWTAGNAMQAASTTLGGKLFWVKVQYVGIVALPVAVLAFAAGYAGYGRLRTRRVLATLSLPLVALLALSLTDEALGHGLVRASATTTTTADGAVVLERTFGPAFWAGWAYSQLLLLAATALLVVGAVAARDVYRRQAALVVGGALVPWVGQLLFLGGVVAVEPEVFFPVTGAALVYAVVRHRFLELQPVARDVVLETLDDALVVVDGRGVVVDANPAAEAILGADVLGEPAEAAFSAHPDLLEAYRYGEGTEVAVAVDGTERCYDVRVRSLGEGGGLEGLVVVLHDVTALAERERELERKNRRLEEFTSLVSHDLQGPLSVASGYVAMERDERDAERLEKTADALDRMDDIIEDLLALAREDEPVEDAERVALPTAARTAWDHVETGDADLAVEADREVEAVRGRLLRALQNLFSNAVGHGDADVVRLVERPAGFAVADDGAGFDDPDEAFEWGYTTDETGTGYGLPIVRRVADAHGWTVTAAASDAGGAEVRFEGVDWADDRE